MTAGTAFTHLRKLEEAGHTTSTKAVLRSSPITSVGVADAARRASENYSLALRQLLASPAQQFEHMEPRRLTWGKIGALWLASHRGTTGFPWFGCHDYGFCDGANPSTCGGCGCCGRRALRT